LSDRRQWGDGEQSIFDALVRRLGTPIGDRGRGQGAYREASRRLTRAGVRADDLAIVLAEYAAAALAQCGPGPLAVFASGGEARDPRFVIVNRWPSACSVCEQEIARGEMCWFRKRAERATLTCSACEEIDLLSERAEVARKRALERDDDPDDLLRRILEHVAPGEREAVEDSLPLSLWASEA
jgi:hypothetical protein